MINEQAVLYSSLIFQWIVFGTLILIVAIILKRKSLSAAANLNKVAEQIEAQITDTEKMLTEVKADVNELEKEIENMSKAINEGNHDLEEVSVNLHQTVSKLNQTISKINKIRDDIKSKIKF